MKNIFFGFFLLLISVQIVWANPTFYLDEGSQTVINNNHAVSLFIDTDGSTITQAQTVLTYSGNYLTYQSLLSIDYQDESGKPNCFPGPFSPSLGLGYKSSPYVDEDNFKIYISCGFPNPGYQSQTSGGDKIATITFSADAVGTETLTFESANTLFYYIGSAISPGAMSSYPIQILSTIEATPGPDEIPEKATDSISAGDLNFVEIGSGGTSVASSNQAATNVTQLEVVESDDTIPPPPDDLLPRPLPTPLVAQDQAETEQSNEGEVLSAQSLRELLIPGKSSADKTVVLINFISALIFLLILGIVIWKLISIKRLSQIRNKHMSELLISELATLESKIGNNEKGSSVNIKTDLGDTIRKISQEVTETT